MHLFILLEVLTFAMAISSWRKHLLFRGQIKSESSQRNQRAAVFAENAGMYGDIFVVSPLVGWLFERFSHCWGMQHAAMAILMSSVASGVMIKLWSNESRSHPDPFGEHGKVNAVGWFHFLYMIPVIAVIILFYFDTPKQFITSNVALTTTILLLVHVSFGSLQPPFALSGKISSAALFQVAALWLMLIAGCWRLIG